METSRPEFRLEENARCNSTLDRLSHELQLPEWDVLLVGDGSGTGGWQHPLGCGWATCVVDRRGVRKLLWGGSNVGSVLLGELSAPAYGLWWYEQLHGKRIRRQDSLRGEASPLRVCVLTDNDSLVQTARQAPELQMTGPEGPMWAFWISALRYGYVASWRHIPRLSVQLNWACDQVAGRCRETLQQVEIGELRFNRHTVCLDELNPLK